MSPPSAAAGSLRRAIRKERPRPGRAGSGPVVAEQSPQHGSGQPRARSALDETFGFLDEFEGDDAGLQQFKEQSQCESIALRGAGGIAAKTLDLALFAKEIGKANEILGVASPATAQSFSNSSKSGNWPVSKPKHSLKAPLIAASARSHTPAALAEKAWASACARRCARRIR